jgi:hypothetical protein
MMVVDASVAAKCVLPEPDSGPAVALRGTDVLIAPSLVIAEIGNALWKSVLRGDVDELDASAALPWRILSGSFPSTNSPHGPWNLLSICGIRFTTVCILRSPSTNASQSSVRTRGYFQPRGE